MSAQSRCTLQDLARVEGKAELIGGRIVKFLPAGHRPGRVAGRIARSLDDYAERMARGEVFGSTLAYAVPELRSGRESFSLRTSMANVGGPSMKRMSFAGSGPS